MKPIKLEDDSREKRKNATKKHKQRRGSNELLYESAVDEDGVMTTHRKTRGMMKKVKSTCFMILKPDKRMVVIIAIS